MEWKQLIDYGANMNLVTPEFVKARGLGMSSIQELNDHNGRIPLSGLGGNVTEPLGYIVIRVQIPYVLSYDEDQVVLAVRDDSCFISQCPVVLGTPTIKRVIRAVKESELESALEAWQSARYSNEYATYMAQMDPANNGITMPTNTGQNPTDLDEIVLLKNRITILAFETAVLHCRKKRTMMMRCKLHVMTQAMYLEDWTNLPNWVYMVKTYTRLHDGSPNVSVVLCNLTGKPVHLAAGWAVVRVVAVNAIPDVTPSPEFLKWLDEMEPLRDPPKKLTVEERQKLLLEVLRKEGQLDKLKEWLPELALKFKWIYIPCFKLSLPTICHDNCLFPLLTFLHP